MGFVFLQRRGNPSEGPQSRTLFLENFGVVLAHSLYTEGFQSYNEAV